MNAIKRFGWAVLLLLVILLSFPVNSKARWLSAHNSALEDEIELTIIGRTINTQDAAIGDAKVSIFAGGERIVLRVADEEREAAPTDAAGFFIIDIDLPRSQVESGELAIEISHPGYRTIHQGYAQHEITCANAHCYIRIPNIVMPRSFNAGFFIATGIFVFVFGFISLNVLHETIAAFLGAAAMLGVSYFIGSFDPDYWIIGFERGIHFIDFNVIFLLMTMMIFMAIMSQTGVFQWMAYQTFRLTRGNAFLVAVILIVITGMTSAVLNDTTVMLLMAPISIQIALALKIHPSAIIIPEVMASNIGGAATLIGTPPNTIIGSYVGLSFNQFLTHMLPIALIGMVILIGMTRWLFRKEFTGESKPPSKALIEKLESDAEITDLDLLRKSLILFGVTMVLFFIEDLFHMPPAVVAIIGSTLLLIWVRPNISNMLREVDWTTLLFFMSLFIMVGGIQEVGLIQVIAQFVKLMAEDNLVLATLLIIWVSVVASAIIANIPFTAAVVPVTVFLTQTIPGAENNVLYWALAVGAGLGGNATYIGSAPNIVATGIMDQAGYRLTFGDFSRIGVPITFVTVLVPTIWILIRYFWLNL
jgi:Na+/H+ antiporter NhaD/arsenite permease-like protein